MLNKLKGPENELAYYYTAPRQNDLPTVVFLGGFMSDMEGSKATAFEAFCQARGQGYLRLDYSGHGQSGGQFIDGTIGSWADDALTVIQDVTGNQPLLLIGSSMGGWISFLAALKIPSRVHAIIGIAAAPDFTREMYGSAFTDAQRKASDEGEIIYLPSDYGDPYPITPGLIADGTEQSLLHDVIKIDCPVRLVQGTEDFIVPQDKPTRIEKALTSNDVNIEWFEGGDHSLSRPEDIRRITQIIDALSTV